MKATTLLVTFTTLIALGHGLKCYSDCGSATVADQTQKTPCDSTKETECTDGQVCAYEKYSFKVLGVSSKIEMAACAPKTDTADVLCDAVKKTVEKTGLADWSCSVKFCEKALCNSGFTAQVSLLVLVAGAMFYGLF